MPSDMFNWFGSEFIESVLKNSMDDGSIQVKDIATKPAIATGDNFLSAMTRASVQYIRNKNGRWTTEKKSLIIKIAPIADGLDKTLVQELRAFDMEIHMMENTLEKMNAILNEKDYRFNARVLYTKSGDPSLLVIEDLAPLGFCMASRQAGLDMSHCILAIKRLAKYHAASVSLYEKEPKSMLTYSEGTFHANNRDSYKERIETALRIVGKEIANWTELGNERHNYSEKIIKLSKVCYEKASKSSRRNNNEFNVLNHGDFWVNNMLFRYNDDGKVIDHIFVDFQLPFWSSPVIDIMYFLNTSLMEEVDLYHRGDLIKEYLHTLTLTMSRLSCKTKPPSIEDLERSMKERNFLAVMTSCLVMPFILADRSQAQTLDQILQKQNDYINPAYKGLAYRKRMLERLPEWKARGLIDV